MTPTPNDYSFLIVHNPWTDAIGAVFNFLVSNWLIFGLFVALVILFFAHRLLLTRYGTDPRWKMTSQEDQLLDYEKQEHPTLQDDPQLPTDHWDI